MNTSNNKVPHLTVVDYLSQYKEDMPQWLSNYNSEAKITFADIMSSRVGYYHGSELLVACITHHEFYVVTYYKLAQ